MILIIEDQDVLLAYLTRCAKAAAPALPVIATTNAVDALAIARAHAADLQLIILDIHMPILDGRMAAVALRRIAPRAWILPCTADIGARDVLARLTCADLLLKPLPPLLDIVTIIQGLLAGPPPAPLALDAADPFVQMLDNQLARIASDCQAQPQVYAALRNPSNADRALVALPQPLIDQIMGILNDLLTRLNGNRLLRRVITLLATHSTP